MAVKAIWAQARDHTGRPVIGHQGDMPWHLPEDLARFQSLTRGHAVIMGRRTWESLPDRFRPLPGRVNIVVTSLDALAGAHVAPSLAGALDIADALEASGDLAQGANRWIIGGARLFADAVEAADALEITEIDLTVEGDTFAPAIPEDRWRVEAASESAVSKPAVSQTAMSGGGLAYRFVTYTRRMPAHQVSA